MKLDASRQFDLEELNKARLNAPNSFWRDHYEKKMHKIVNESGNLSGLRNDLISAVRSNDQRSIHRIQQKIMYLRNSQTNGHLDH